MSDVKPLQMSFSAATGDAKLEDGTLGNPQALVARRKEDGSVSLTVLAGDDAELTRGLYGLVVAFKKMKSKDFMAAQKALFASKGIDMDALINAEMGVEPEAVEG